MAYFSELDTAIGEAVKSARLKAGISQQAIADAMTFRGFDFHQPTVGKIERGERRVTIGEAFALADVFGMDLELFLGVHSSPDMSTMLRSHQGLADAMRLLEEAVERYASRREWFLTEFEQLEASIESASESSARRAAETYARTLRKMEIPARNAAIRDVISKLEQLAGEPDA